MRSEEVKDMLGKNRWPQKSRSEITETLGVAETVSLDLMKDLHRIRQTIELILKECDRLKGIVS